MTRRLLGIAGSPGAGKSTLARWYVARTGASAVQVPMDGFHLADVALESLGLRDRKGAPETFDAWGYAALLARLRAEPTHTVWAPAFERDLEQPLAGAVPVPPETGLVVTEGNYLLLDRPEWRAVRAQLDEVWFVHADDAVRRARLVARHVAFGKTPAAARAWVTRVDEPNARLVAEGGARADRVLDLSGWDGVEDPVGDAGLR
jgi:pantothenate kinase